MQSVAEIPLAIIGMGCRLPGADDLDGYWRLLLEGRTNLGELPPERLDRELYFHPDKGVRTKSYTSLGGLTTNNPFDHAACPISEDLYERAHHVHLMLLEVMTAACRNAGLDPFQLPSGRVGVYTGHTPPSTDLGPLLYSQQVSQTAQYLKEIPGFRELVGDAAPEVIAEIIERARDTVTSNPQLIKLEGNAYHAPALVARAFNVNGPVMSFDAACASGMRALGHAARALQLGRIDMALVGAASCCSCETLILFSAAQSLSAHGSRPFDEDADGLVASEGSVGLIIKTLAKALEDGDPIQAVIRGVGISSDGKGKSLWAPRHEGQVEAIRRAYPANVSLRDLQFIEMHATSTQVGDATEMIALTEAFKGQLPEGARIPVGSAKANVGHTLEVAGLASVAKTVLAMQNGVIPPQININKLNKKIDWDNLPFFVPQEPLEWQRPAEDQPRRAAVNAFGIGGLNVHVVLDEHIPERSRALVPVNAITTKSSKEPIAIIGMGAVLPGARTIDALWDLLSSGRDMRIPAPADRWPEGVENDEGAFWKATTRLGGFITDFHYDWKKHKVPPKQVATADPLQFMLLDAADQAFRDAGYGPEKPIQKAKTGVIVGTVFGAGFGNQLQMGLHLPDFQRTLGEVLARRGVPPENIAEAARQFENKLLEHMPALIDETGSFTASTLASRITKTFDLMGGAVAVDAGDASATTALSSSIDLLRAGDCDVMVCAAGHRAMDYTSFAMWSRTGLLAKGNELRGPFEVGATGAIPGEAVGVLILKRLSDAVRDGDTVRGVIHGVGIARNESLRDALKDAAAIGLEDAGIAAKDVSVIEAGTAGCVDFGEQEVAALAEVYSANGTAQQKRFGALVGQIGYAGGASGMVSLLKAVSELGHAQMPANVGLSNPAGYLTERASVFELGHEAKPIEYGNEEGRLFAAVDSFSQFGLACQVIVEGSTRVAPSAAASGAAPAVAAPVTAAAAASEDSLFGSRWRVLRLASDSLTDLRDQGSRLASDPAAAFAAAKPVICNEPRSGYSVGRFRVAIIAETADELAAKIDTALKQMSNPAARAPLAEKGIFMNEVAAQSKVAFLFPGQGSQYDGMFQALAAEFAPARDALAEIDAVLKRLDLPSFAELAWGESTALGSDVWQTQLSLLAADTLMLAAVTAMGLKADRVAGHSFGELVALVAAGAWSFEQAVHATAARCQSIEQCQAGGKLLSTSAPADALQRICAADGGRVFISHYNAPDQTVAGGDADAVARIAEAINAAGHKGVILDVPAAFHTPLMDGVKEPFGAALDRVPLDAPRIPLLSSVTNSYVSDPAEIRRNLVVQMTEPVRYTELVERLVAEGTTVLVELGPRQVLTGLHRRILSNGVVPYLACDHTKRQGMEQLAYVRVCVETTGALDPERSATTWRIPDVAAKPQTQSVVESTPAAPVAEKAAPVAVAAADEKHAAVVSLVNLSGSPYEMGFAHGRELADAVQAVLRRHADLAGSKWDQLIDVDAAVARAEQLFGAAELEELKGIADGAGVSRDGLIAHNVRLFLDAGAGGAHFAVTAAANPADGLVHAVNEDSRAALPIRGCLRRHVQSRTPSDALPHVAFSVAGQVGTLNGINAAGVAASLTALLDATAEPTLDGLLPTVAIKRVLESAVDLDSAVAVLQQNAITTPCTICLTCAAEDRICYVEWDGQAFHVSSGAAGIVATNHRLLVEGASAPGHSSHRLNRLHELLAGQQVSAHLAQQTLRDRLDPSESAGNEWPTLNSVRRVDNQISIVMQPSTGRVWTTDAHATNGTQDSFACFDLGELLKPVAAQPQAPTAAVSDTPVAIASQGLEISAEALRANYAAAESESAGATCRRLTLRLAEGAAIADDQPLPIAGTALVLGDNVAAQTLAQALADRGLPVYLLANSDAGEALAAIDSLWQTAPIQHLFLMTAWDADAATSLEQNAWNSRGHRGATVPYLVTQRWFQLVREADLVHQASLTAATALGGDFGLHGQVLGVESGAISGLLKGVNMEVEISGPKPKQPGERFRVKVVDFVVTEDPARVAEAVCRELAADEREVEVGYFNGRRVFVRPVAAPIAELAQGDLPQGVNVVVTGGARGVTAVVARELGKRYGLKLNLIGSSPAPQISDSYHSMSEAELKEVKAIVMKEAHANGEKPPEAWARFEKALEIDRTLRSFAAEGIQATYHACDVSDRVALGALLNQIRAADGPIAGVVHGAGFERASRFERKQPELVERTLAAKVDGAAALMELTANDPVQFFALFGSVSGRFGGVGQTDYCMANDMLAKLADWYRVQRPECRTTCFHWHAWDDVGMAVRPESQHIRKLHDIHFMPSAEGAEHLHAELRAGLPEGEILITELRDTERMLGSLREATDYRLQTTGAAGGTGSASGDPEGLDAEHQELQIDNCQLQIANFGNTEEGPLACASGSGLDISRFPLIDAVVEYEPNSQLVAEAHLQPAADVFLRQHRYKGRPLLPVVIGMEMMLEAASLLAGSQYEAVAINNLQIANGLRFLHDNPQAARISARFVEGGIECQLTADLQNRNGRVLEQDRLCLSAVVEFAARRPEMTQELPPPDGKWFDVGYPDADLVIYHGPPFRRLQEICGKEGTRDAWGRLIAHSSEELAGSRNGNWILPCAIVDGTLFGCGISLWVLFGGVVAIPKGINRLQLGSRTPREGEVCMMHLTNRDREGNCGIFDATAFGEDGTVLFAIEGYINQIVAQDKVFAPSILGNEPAGTN